MENELMPAWEVTIYGLAISMPWIAAKVGWLESASHPKRTFRSLSAAKRHASHVEAMASWSLVPIAWRGEIRETTRPRDWRDKVSGLISNILN